MASPYVVGKPKTVVKKLTVGAPNRDGTGTGWVDLVSGTAAGVVIVAVRIKAKEGVNAGMVRFAVYDGTNANIYDEVQVVETLGPGGNVKSFEATWYPPTPLTLDSTSHRFRGAAEYSEAFDLTISYGDMT